MRNSITRRSWLRATTSLVVTAFMFTAGINITEAAGKGKIKGPGAFKNSINLVPTITNITAGIDGLVASGTVSATLKGTTTTVPFSNVPVNLSLAPDQSGAGACPILDLSLAPITLDLLGLVVETSPICLQITAYDDGGLLGDLLCSVANLLNGGVDLADILNGAGLVDPGTGTILLPGLTASDITSLLQGVGDLLNGALAQLLQNVLTAIGAGDNGACSVLHLELGPVDLNLLGLEVILDDCTGGPVVVDITAVPGPGKLLGNLLCELLGGSGINLGGTLANIISQLLALLNA
jgi:hypothetical protein